MSSQIPLPFGNFNRFTFDLYLIGPNQQVVDKLKQVITDRTGEYLYLWGGAGTGKSHLLQAACGFTSILKMKPGYVPLANSERIVPEMLEGLETLDCICIDDLDSVAGIPEWETGMFNLFNSLAENKKSLIVSSAKSPFGNDIKLPDLKSRLASGVTYHLKSLEQDDKLVALKQRAHYRGFEVSDDVLEYLSRRVSRDMHSLFDWLDRMDEATLASKKKLSVSFVKGLLGDNI